ncbi:MAG: RNA polymerase sigma factor [Desulfotomaculaceae bacterium]|nr:RNA polymerase sigma factor [Desulfotomaculaceae bacterium]
MKTNTEHDLIIRCRKGDEQAWRLLLTRYEAYVYRLCFRISGSRDDALDLTQEALVKVLNGLVKFQPGRPFKPWLRQVTVNSCSGGLLLRRYPWSSRLPKTLCSEIPLTAAQMTRRLSWNGRMPVR